MGRWSRHPMGSDGALDAKDIFMADCDIRDKDGEIVEYYFDRDEREVRKYLSELTVKDLEKIALRSVILDDNRFVIPYTFIEYNVHPTDPKIKAFLLDCLDYTEDFEEYGNGAEAKHVQFFKDNFDMIISGQMILENDSGLLSALSNHIANGEPGLINKTKNN